MKQTNMEIVWLKYHSIISIEGDAHRVPWPGFQQKTVCSGSPVWVKQDHLGKDRKEADHHKQPLSTDLVKFVPVRVQSGWAVGKTQSCV